ncbi:transposase family protein [Aquibacillus salsiterrae]|uniref:Transposase family protein n=1 Tax=Aquibacillus salsiterrae TaxID=2950439 RepID=A0A9X4AE83_9BACI|nr:transposase family protein [Aquibacillus salsiterrae]MDC3416214.1 transposase family protein [Aquibacillus salsiterrae]
MNVVSRKEKREHEKDTNYFFELMKIKNHFMKDLDVRFKNVKDPRHQGYITYDCDILLFMIILKNVCNLKSMRSMTNHFNKEECIDNVGKILGLETLEELPQYDTINDFLSELDPKELEDIRTYIIKELLKKSCFDRYRINGKYWGVIVDGTGLFSFDHKHCDHCLRREYTDKETGEKKTVYMHHVLEAKLVIGDMVLSIASEFIENESEDVSKQDCELKAFYRLAEKLKDSYKRLPSVLGDSLYACEGVFNQCNEFKWKYMFRFKGGRIKSISKEFQKIKEMEQGNASSDIFWVNQISYNQRTVNVLECKIGETKEDKKQFTFITDIKITKRYAKNLVVVGRSRWKIENQGFNRQKNIRYHIEHASSKNYVAMKNHYLLAQIADILMLLYEKGCRMLKSFQKTAKEISSNLLEAIRTRRLTDEDISMVAKPIQVRFT